MLSALALGAAMLFSAPADACPMADAAEYAAAAEQVEAADGTKASFKVDGMTCGSCSSKVIAALTAVDGVHAAAVDYQTGEAKVAFDATKTDAASLKKVIEETGYAAANNS